MRISPLLVLEGYLSARSPGVRKPCRGWSAWVDADTRAGRLVGPWQYQCTGWVVPRYSTLPVPHRYTPPRYPPRPHPHPVHPMHAMLHAASSAVRTASLTSPKEILGVDNAHHPRGRINTPATTLSRLLIDPCSGLPVGGLALIKTSSKADAH